MNEIKEEGNRRSRESKENYELKGNWKRGKTKLGVWIFLMFTMIFFLWGLMMNFVMWKMNLKFERWILMVIKMLNERGIRDDDDEKYLIFKIILGVFFFF